MITTYNRKTMTETTNNLQQKTDDGFPDLRKLFFKFLANWIWFFISFMAFVAIGFGYVSTLPPQYRISASLLIKDKKTEGLSTKEELDMFYKANVVENEIEILKSYTLLEEVVDELNFQVRYYIEDGWRKKELYGNLPVKIEIVSPKNELFSRPFTLRFENDHVIFNEKTYPIDALITESFGSIRISSTSNSLSTFLRENEKPILVFFIPKASLIESLHGSLQVSLQKNTSVINLSILSPMPQRGEDFLNHLIIAYNKAAIAEKINQANITLNSIEERLELVEKNLRKAEQDVEEYKTVKGITDISTESSIFLQNQQRNDSEVSRVKTQLDILQQIEQYVLSNASSAAPATLGLSDPTLVSLIASLTDAEAERIRLLSTTQPASLRVRAIDDQITTLKGKLIENIHVLRRSLETTQRNLNAESRRMAVMINSIPQKTRQLTDFTRQEEIINQLYSLLLAKREETAISNAAIVADSRIVYVARSTPFPIKPNKRLLLIIFGFIGLAVPVGIIWLIDRCKTTIESKDELENRLKAPIVGEILFIEQANKILLEKSKNKNRHTEQIRTLRTNIEFMRAGGGIKVILITSGISGEGKTFLSANLGAAFAALKRKTIMLGFDLRKSGLDKIVGIDNDEGLTNYLAGQATLDQLIRPTEISDYLHVITCGRISPNPQELLSGDLLQQLIDQLKEKYDYIVIDTSPVGIMSDALILARFADVTLFVIRQNYTRFDRIKNINDLYNSKRLNNLGVVVNGIKDDKWNGYGYGYGSYKYYSTYYGNEDPDPETGE